MGVGYVNEQRAAVAAVRDAARLCRAVQGRITADVLQKKDNSPVTVADFGSQALICRALAEAFAGDAIIAEEDSAELREGANAGLLERVVAEVGAIRRGADGAEVCRWIDLGGGGEYRHRFWTLDPIDGTKGFVRREQYAIALALIVEGRIEVSALACPNLPFTDDPRRPVGAIFTAVRGGGTTMIALDDEDSSLVGPKAHVTGTSDAASARFCESVESGHSSHDDSAAIARRLGITAEPYRIDSQCKYAAVARGDADIYLRLPTKAGYVEKIWDHAAGVLCVTEAGGRVTDIHGRELEFTHGRGLEVNRGVIVTNGRLHEQVLEAIEAVGIATG